MIEIIIVQTFDSNKCKILQAETRQKRELQFIIMGKKFDYFYDNII